MRVIENNAPPTTKPEWPKEVKCRHCASIIELDKTDITTGTAFYSQREIDYNVRGFNCPCCRQFSAI